MNYNCAICQSKQSMVLEYDRHVFDWSFKGIIKRMLPFFDIIIPLRMPLLKMYSSRKISPFNGDINICNNCGYGIMNSIPNEQLLKSYYMNDYWTLRSKGIKPIFKKRFLKNTRAIAQSKFFQENINKKLKVTKILEIGAAHASSSLLIRKNLNDNNIELYSCESGDQWVDYYRDANIKHIANFFPFDTDMKFNYIHTSHWLEHVSDVENSMIKINSMLSDKGALFIEVPNTEFFYWDYPQTDTPHIHFFSPKSLRKLGENHGFKCLRLETFGNTFKEIYNGKIGDQSFNLNGCYIRALFEKNN